MKKTFYSHLVEIEFLEEELNSLNLEDKEREELLYHVHSSIHYTVLDTVLSELPEEHKETFLKHVEHENHTEALTHILNHTKDMEEKIKTSIKDIAQTFLKDIHELKKEEG